MHRNAKKAAVLVVILILVAATLAGCGGAASLPKPATTNTAAMVKVSGSCDLTIANGKAKLACKTDMMDGSIFKLSIHSPTGKLLASTIITKSGDNLNAEFDLNGITDKTIYGFATCSPQLDGKQSDAILNKYGSRFEYIQSDNTEWTNETNILVLPSKPQSF